MQTEIYRELEARGVTLARAAASGDAEAEGELVETLGELTRAPYPNEGWPRSGSVAYAVFDAFLEVDDGDREALRRLVGPFMAAIMAHPDQFGVPYRFEPAEMLGPSAIPLARVYARREGLGPELDKLESRRRTITSGYKKPKAPRE